MHNYILMGLSRPIRAAVVVGSHANTAHISILTRPFAGISSSSAMTDPEVRDKIATTVPSGLISFKIINVGIFGLTCYQVFRYYIRNREDRTSLKILFAILWTTEAINIIAVPMNYDRLPNALDKPDAYPGIVWTLAIVAVAGSIGDLILQGMICRRILRLSNRGWVPLLVLIILSIASAVINPHLPTIILSGTLCFLLSIQDQNTLRLRRITVSTSICSALAYVVSIGALAPLCLITSVILNTSLARSAERAFQFAMLYNPVVQKLYLNAVLAALIKSWEDERVGAFRSGDSIELSSSVSRVESRGTEAAARE
ncbi:hypothetical protein OH76DRAFT_963926 [Lentinus brumalis]|uniref:Uncharacterized protein n=1 Tax=Lentinus brumalis TaxID=2498619 RepID=A0A371DPN6_9APHY|nr:hypothetical protein OH76DRAFT_963926 [Polyporus brumalis]